MKKATVKFAVPMWASYTEPLGRLVNTAECQALWYYFTLAIANWEREKQELQTEDEPDLSPNYERLFRNSAVMYGADIEKMANYWPLVDKELDRQNMERVLQKEQKAITKLPQHLRFVNKPIVVKEKKKLN